MSHELELPIETTPVDDYVQELTTEGTKNPWEPIPDGAGFRLNDQKRGLVTSLICQAATDQYLQYQLEVKRPNGTLEMRSVDWMLTSNTSALHKLYCELVEDFAEKSVADSPHDDDMNRTDALVNALIQDVQSKRQRVQIERSEDGFVSAGFGVSESVITIRQDSETQYSIKVEKPDGSIVLSCTETSQPDNDEAEVRKLYGLLDKTVPIASKDIAITDAERFIFNKNFDRFFDRVLEYAIPDANEQTDPLPAGAISIRRIFDIVCEPRVIQHFIDEVALRRGPISEVERKRLKTLAQSVFAFIRNTNHSPNGCVFTGRAIPVAYVKPGLVSRRVKMSSSLSRIASAYTTWPRDIFGEHPSMNEATVMSRTAVLLLAAILADQIP